MKKVALHNLGCKVNSYEIEVMQQMLQEKGHQIVPFDEVADIYIVNTCTVTNIADRKSRQMLHRAKQKNPEAVVVAVGCYVQTGKEAVLADESIDLCIGNNRKKDILTILETYLAERERENDGQETLQASSCVTTPKTLNDTTVININETYEYEEMTLHRTAEHTRAYIKIQDGCNQFCSYCVIPYARGRVRSRHAEDVLAEIKGIVAAGYKEVVLTGIHISSYGIDFDEEAWSRGKSVEVHRSNERRDYSGSSKLLDLIERIHEIEGLERIRLGSLEPRIVTLEAAKRLAALPKICPHFHLSLQSGCDETLARMNRHYTTGEYFQSVNFLRQAFDTPAITTDVIVGFPGETEEEFAKTKEFLEKICFYEMHIFKYSKREGTRAAVMPGQVPDRIKTIRSNELLAMEKIQSEQFRKGYLGREAQVLPEEMKEINGKNYFLGHTVDYVKVAIPVEGNEYRLQENVLVKVQVKSFLTEDVLLGDFA